MRTIIVLSLLAVAGIARAQVATTPNTQKPVNKEQVAAFSSGYTSLQQDLQLLEKQRAELEKKLRQHDSTLKATTIKLQQWEKQSIQLSGTLNNTSRDAMSATKQLQETQMSFSLQYLNLKEKMQNESRHFLLISNILKTKHDTVKNSISNVR
jgi:predicted  nucleic acid-binding Zn-ribbon protein